MPSIPPETAPEGKPALVLDVGYLDRVDVGSELEFEITVRNTGDCPLHDVQVVFEVPQQLEHSDGKLVSFAAGDMATNERKATKLRLKGIEAGLAVSNLRVAAMEPIIAKGQATIRVVDAKANTEPPSSGPAAKCCCQNQYRVDVSPTQFPLNLSEVE
jgi:uncharacterized repeat protein (TIGR01451 family)